MNDSHFIKNYDIAIIGLGLIGTSFLKAISNKGYKIWGLDINKKASEYALKNGYIIKNDYDIENAIKESSIIILSVMPDIAIDIIKKYKYAIDSNTIISDFCGVKRDIFDICKDVNYIGVHTMAGLEVGGYENSSETLFHNRNAIITKNNIAKKNDVETIKKILYDIGCSNIVESDSEKHDKQIAFTSQLMHIVACAIVSQGEFLDSIGFEGNSLRDHTRVGTIDANMWSELFISNKDYLSSTIRNYINVLEKYEHAIQDNDKDSVKNLLQFANENKKRWMNEKHYSEP